MCIRDRLYINFMCEGVIALANSEYIGYSSPNTAALALMDEEMKSNEIAYPSEELSLIHIFNFFFVLKMQDLL